MKKNPSFILYIITILIILGGLFMFIFRDSLLDALRQQTGVDSAAKVSDISAMVATVATSSALDVSILQLPRFTSLVNQVTNFNFDNICWRPDTATSKPVVSEVTSGKDEADSGAATSTEESAAGGCVQGNSLPFNVKKK